MSSSDPSVKPYHGGYSYGNVGNGAPVVGNPQNYGFSNQPIPTAAPQPSMGTTYTIGAGVAHLNYSNSSGSSIKSTPPVLMWDPIGPTSSVTFYEEENGVRVSARLEPDAQISAIETMRIMLLVTHLSTAGLMLAPLHDAKPISYIRSHNLERHFRFAQ
jgi:hypothetical protein